MNSGQLLRGDETTLIAWNLLQECLFKYEGGKIMCMQNEIVIQMGILEANN